MNRFSRFCFAAFLSVSVLFTGCQSIKKTKKEAKLIGALILLDLAQDTRADGSEKMKNGPFESRPEGQRERAATKNI